MVSILESLTTTMDYAALKTGQQISSESIHLDGETVANFRNAVDDQSLLSIDREGETLVPPMAAAALSFRGAIKALRIPGGTLHLSQEITFSKSINIGDKIQCEATITRNSLRKKLRFIQIETCVTDQTKEKVLVGKSTITIPDMDRNE